MHEGFKGHPTRGMSAWTCISVMKKSATHSQDLSLQGRQSHDIQDVLGFLGSEEVVHRDNISMLTLRRPPPDATTPPPGYAVTSDADDEAEFEPATGPTASRYTLYLMRPSHAMPCAIDGC